MMNEPVYSLIIFISSFAVGALTGLNLRRKPHSILCIAKGGAGGINNGGGGAGGTIYIDENGDCHAFDGEDGQPGEIDFYKRLDGK